MEQEIREALEGRKNALQLYGNPNEYKKWISEIYTKSPEWLEWCLSQIAELRKENERLKGGSSK